MNTVNNPISTYRVQLHQHFTFKDLGNIADYLQKLGVKTLYASPVFESMPGSTHGYDGTHPNRINSEIGTEEELVTLARKLADKGIQWLQDIVPNHLAFHEKNEWLIDVLRNGRDSRYAVFFDILWDHPRHPGRVMVPFPGSPLESFLKEQVPDDRHYVVTDWRETDTTINYRRFFTVNSLICTNVQDDTVFDEYHQLIGRLVAENVFQGLRVDHVDGLYDPKKYLAQLEKLAGKQTYVIVEKILEPDENLPDDWRVQGTSGYEFLGMVNNLLTNHAAAPVFDELYQAITGDDTPVQEQITQKKLYILQHQMRGELDNLTRLYRSCGGGTDMDDEQVWQAITAYLVDCPVYRYYGNDIPLMKHDEDSNNDNLDLFYRRAMQFTGPLMAKGVEDTLMYTYNRFIGHNEVGDAPQSFGISTDQFHSLMHYRQRHWPLGLNATSTHDTKRGEDARARLNALTDFPEEWVSLVEKWRRDNAPLKTDGMPDGNDEYFIYQTLVATYPPDQKHLSDYRQRITAYLQKSFREAKTHSDWASPNTAYETAAARFAHALIEGQQNFNDSFLPFLHKVFDYGAVNSLAQLMLKFTCPGVPDTYQGTELWDLSLVDPDNRRPVDYTVRKKLVAEGQPFYTLWNARRSGQIKLSFLHRLLLIRNEYANIFSEGGYVPLELTGRYNRNGIAFLRTSDKGNLLIVAPLHISQVSGDGLDRNWEDTKIILPPGFTTQWKDILKESGSVQLDLQTVFQQFPLAILSDQ